MTTNTTAQPLTPANLEVTFNLLADHMNGEAADGHTMTPADVVESYTAATGVHLTPGDAAHLSARLADVARAIATFGPF